MWFDECGAEDRMISFLNDLESQDFGMEHQLEAGNASLRIADVGTGNGHLLFALREEGWLAEMVGLDYSETSIGLCRRIAAQRDAAAEQAIRFELFDFLKGTPGPWAQPLFDLVLDKGTFDAISLDDSIDPQTGLRGCELYARNAAQLMQPGRSLLVVTSCNWTAQELQSWFAIDQFEVFDTIAFPSFEFGGRKGQAVSAVCFRRTQKP